MVYIVYKLLVKVVPKYRSLNSKIRLTILFGLFFLIILAGLTAPETEPITTPEEEPIKIEQNINDNTATEEVKEETTEPEVIETITQTVSQRNAIKSAESYNDMGGFSRGRLIEQLEFEGFTKEQAEYGVNAIGL
jgi:hypothetical protein